MLAELAIANLACEREIWKRFRGCFVFQSRVSTKTVVMETLKKVIKADRCIICSTAVARKEKLYIFGKSSIDFCEIIKSAPLKLQSEKRLS